MSADRAGPTPEEYMPVRCRLIASQPVVVQVAAQNPSSEKLTAISMKRPAVCPVLLLGHEGLLTWTLTFFPELRAALRRWTGEHCCQPAPCSTATASWGAPSHVGLRARN